MVRVWQRPSLAVLIPAGVFAGVAALLVGLLPGPRGPLHYMVAGSLATTGSLASIFIRLAGAKIIRRKKSSPEPGEVPAQAAYRIFGPL